MHRIQRHFFHKICDSEFHLLDLPYTTNISVMNIQGKLHVKYDTKQVTESFRKREFVIEFIDGNPMYPQYLLFQLIQDKCDALDGFTEGAQVDVSFNLRGREWKSPQGEIKYFNSLDAWRIVPATQSEQSATPPPPVPPAGAVDVSEIGDSDDLPF